jgi:molybdenum cofactor cytidylyltransferase
MNCGIVLLAAGSSSRLGKPKQLLQYKGQSLLKQALDAAADATHANNNLAVVIGANAEAVKKEIAGTKAAVVVNTDWNRGMASSIIKGLTGLLEKQPLTDAVIIMTCDQPFVNSLLLAQLISMQQQTGKRIVTSNYGDTTGPPTLFHKELFEELLALEGDKGARMIVQKHVAETVSVPFPLGNIDIDTLQDYETLLEENKDKQ